jgi:hypothetical protein
LQRLLGSNRLSAEKEKKKEDKNKESRGEIVYNLDKAYLLLYIFLLNYTLQGNYFKSIVLSFLAILGINKNPSSIFYSLLSYLPNLFKFIKIAQILVVQYTVVVKKKGKVKYPSNLLKEMQ